MKTKIATYKEFWPFYLGEHSLNSTRWIHFVGTCIAFTNIVLAIVTLNPVYLLGALFSGYLFAWVSHFFVEKNRPATFTYPFWSFFSDWRMWALMMTGQLNAELKKFNITPKTFAADQAAKV